MSLQNFLYIQYNLKEYRRMPQETQITETQIIKRQNNANQNQIQSQLSVSQKGGKNSMLKKIQNGRETRFAFQRLLNFDYCLLLFCLMNIILSVLYCDADYRSKFEVSRWCLLMLDPITILEVIITIFRYKAQVQLEICQRILQQSDGVFSSGKLAQIAFEITILLIQPYDFLDTIHITMINIYDQFQFQYKLNYVLVVLGFLKVFIALRVLLLRQSYMNPRSSRLCRMYGCQSDYLYAVKCLFKDSPISLISIVFGSSIIIFAVCLRIAERNLVIEYPKYFNGTPYPTNMQHIQNAIWLTIITMTTVGYGDLFPRTLFGRLIDVVLVIWGTFIVSLMVVALTNTLNMEQSEKRALIVLNRLETKKSLKDAAAYVITYSCRRYLINKKIKNKQIPSLSEAQKSLSNGKLYKYILNFKDVHHSIRSMYQIDDLYQEMSRQFQSINDQISLVLTGQQKIIISAQQLLKVPVMNMQKQIKEKQKTNDNLQNIRLRPRQRTRQKSHEPYFIKN